MRSSLMRVIALSFVLLAVGCSRLVPLMPTAAVLLPRAQEEGAVRAAIVRALSARRFVVESEEPGRIIARYQRRRMVLRVQIDYSGSQYEVIYLDSVGLGHRVDEQGQALISRHYPRYVRRLTRTVDQELGRPAREAAEAIERERQQQLALAREETAREQARLAAEQRERDAQRNAALEEERLRTQRAQAEAAARRPVIVAAPEQGVVVGDLAFDVRSRARAGYGVLRARGRRFGGSRTGYAGGPLAARSMFPDYCRGFFAEQPSHILQVDRARPVRIEVSASIDTTLAIVTSDGRVWCDDDGAGNLNPRIEGQLPAGTYYVWVGVYDAGRRARYRLSFTRYDAPRPAARPARVAVSRARFQGLLESYRATRMFSEQPGVAVGYVRAGNRFTCAQIADLVRATRMFQDQVDVAVALWEGVVDRENAHLISAAFTMHTAGAEFRSRVGL